MPYSEIISLLREYMARWYMWKEDHPKHSLSKVVAFSDQLVAEWESGIDGVVKENPHEYMPPTARGLLRSQIAFLTGIWEKHAEEVETERLKKELKKLMVK